MRIEKLNTKQKLLTAEQARNLPALYAQDGKGYQATVYAKFFTPWAGLTWYATEYDPAEQRFFGVCFNSRMTDQMPCGEFGYFMAEELASARGPYGLRIERDIHFQPQTLANALKREHGVDVPSKEETIPTPLDSREAAAVLAFDAA